METPIYNRLEAYIKQNRIPFAMPGHKNGRGFDVNFMSCDVTELPKTLNLFGNDETVLSANRLLSEGVGSEQSFILTGGSTLCLQIMIASSLKRGDTLLVTSDCHISVINICELLGIKLKVVGAHICENYFIPDGKEEIEITPDVSAVLITSPNYYGMVKDIKAIADKCRNAGVMLLVDEAHGAHFTGRYGLPVSAVKLGADMVCQSAHKTLNALTGAAYLHIASERVDISKVKRFAKMLSTSSPSYPVAASADIARATLCETDYSDIINEIADFKAAAVKAFNIHIPDTDDVTRLVLNFREYNITGFEMLEILSDKYSIDAEMADLFNVVFIITPYNTHSDFMSLFFALSEILRTVENRREVNIPAPVLFDDSVVDVSCVLHKPTENVLIKESAGRVCAQTVYMYPPATAVVFAGQIITEETAEYIEKMISAGADVFGIKDDRIEVLL